MSFGPGKKFLWIYLAVALSAILVFGWQQAVNQEGQGSEKPGGKVSAAINDPGEREESAAGDASGKTYLEVNVLAASEKDKQEIISLVDLLGGTVIKGIKEEGLNLRIKITEDAIGTLKSSPCIEKVEPYSTPEFLNDRASGVIGPRPLQVPGFVLPGGLTGAGQIVAVADSGLDIGVNNSKIHPDFRSEQGQPSKIVDLKSVAGDLIPADPVGHGTHVAGSILGTGAASGGKFRGVAPEARLYFQSILNAKDQPDPPANLSELFEPAYRAGARIHVNSWGTQTNSYTITASQIDAFMRSHPEFLAVFGAGNAGAGPNGKGTLVAEANSKNALVVGAVENPRPAFGAYSDSWRDVADFSSRGPAADGRMKPDLVAPGTAVISTRSSLTPSNFEPNRYYTRMDGTSSAAALVAGSAALLREYFVSTDSKGPPSASLIKAALVNGAVRLGHSRAQEGYGLADIQGTVLSLRNGAVLYDDHKNGLDQGGYTEYIYMAEEASGPLKVTMAWTDPPAAPGTPGNSLVNDLDLIVTGPDGRVYYGNDFDRQGRPDRLNNLEQVYIDKPQPGSYLIKVAAAGVKVDAAPEKPGVGQDFSIVFGQPMERGIIESVTGAGKIILSGSRVLNTAPGASIHLARDGISPDGSLSGFKLPTGADIYYWPASGKATDLYVSYTTVFAESVKGYELGDQKRLSELRPNYSEGGFSLPRSPYASLLVNGAPAGFIEEVLPGSDVVGIVNPGTGELWQGEAAYSLKTGRVSAVDPLTRKITTAESGIFQLSRLASIRIDNKWSSISPFDEPFARTAADCLQCLPVGSEAVMVISPWTREVRMLSVENRMVSGKVTGTRPGKIMLDGGKQYNLPNEAIITKNGRSSGEYSIKPGDWVEGILATGSDDKLIKIEAFSRVIYGSVKEAAGETNSVAVKQIQNNKVELFNLANGASVYRTGMPASPGDIRAGDFVRLALNDSGGVLRLDASVPQNENIVIKEIAAHNGFTSIESQDGKKYALAPYAPVRKAGLKMAPEDLAAGDRAVISLLPSLMSQSQIISGIDAEAGPGAAVPGLNMRLSVQAGDGGLTVWGATTGDEVYVFLDDKDGINADLEKDGSFNLNLKVKENGPHTIKVAAVDRSSGGVGSISRTLFWHPQESAGADFKGTWAEKEIRSVVEKGLIQLYPDGSFRPGGLISRGSLAAALNDAIGVSRGDLINVNNRDVPVTRLEGVVLLSRAARTMGIGGEAGGSIPPFFDWPSIPGWGREAVVSAYRKGLVAGTPEGNLEPDRRLTRAEAAALLSRLEDLLKG